MILLAEKSEDGEFGVYKCPFEIQLPANLPPSLNFDEENTIKYKINATAGQTSTTKEFKVKNQINLNNFAYLNTTYAASSTKIFCCWCCKSEPFKVEFILPKTGYLAGEFIHFKVIIDNKSYKKIEDLDILLFQYFKFFSNGGFSKFSSHILNYVRYSKIIEPRSLDTWDGKLFIPVSTQPTSFETCKIIRSKYSIELTTKCHQTCIPIVIGTIPFTNKENLNSIYI